MEQEIHPETESYRIHLEAFEGPLDLLLHLIKKEDVDIYDIPISHLLKKYLEALNLARELNIDLAGEFLEMASELTYIKSKMLLPELPAEEEEGPDPRADLVQRLQEYRRYKEAAKSLLGRPLLGTDVFARSPAESQDEDQDREVIVEADAVSLLSALQQLIRRLPSDRVHEIRQVRIGVAERIIELSDQIRGKREIPFEELFARDGSRGEMIVTFLSVLEMAKQGLIRILQERLFQRMMIQPLIVED